MTGGKKYNQMKKKWILYVVFLCILSCDEVRELMDQSIATEISWDFELEVPEGVFTVNEPFREIWHGQLDLSDNEFPDQVRNSVSDLFSIQIPNISLEITDIEGDLNNPAMVWGNLTFSDPDTGQELVRFELPEMPLQEEGTIIQVPMEDALVDQLTSSLLSMQKLDYALELLYGGEGPVNATTELTVPMEIGLQLF
jgi:hypothetical protein